MALDTLARGSWEMARIAHSNKTGKKGAQVGGRFVKYLFLWSLLDTRVFNCCFFLFTKKTDYEVVLRRYQKCSSKEMVTNVYLKAIHD